MRPHKEKKLQDIADALGVSVVSVSNAIRGKKGVSEKLRQNVFEYAEKLGINTDAYSSATENKTDNKKKENSITLPVAVVVSKRYIEIGTSFYWEMYQKTAYTASAEGCITALEIADDDRETEPPLMIQRAEVSGVIIIGPMRDAYLKALLSRARCPVVFMDQQINFGKYSAVLSGNYYGMYKSARELVLAGHKEIGFIGALEKSRNIIDRYYGYKKCMRECGLKVERKWILTDRTGENETPKIDLPSVLPTAFVCSGDYSAAILYNALKKKGLNVPEDISIASYDDYLNNHELSGKLTTYRVDMEKMAKCAVRTVLHEIDNPEDAGMIYEIDSDVVLRDSIRRI